MTNEIQWQDGAVCYAAGVQWFFHYEDSIISETGQVFTFSEIIRFDSFQLNEIRTGDFIAASELDTEQKYNNVVEVFGLFGFPRYEGCTFKQEESAIIVADEDGDFVGKDLADQYCRRQLTYSQIMTIGKLKRMSDEKTQTVNRDIERNLKDGDKYHREIVDLDGTKTIVDVYRVLDAFPTNCAATDHAIKKMLCAGLRGHKDKITDIDNAIESLQAARKLLIQKGA